MESTILSVAQGFNLKCTKSKVYKDKFGHICATTRGAVRIQRAGSRRVQTSGSGRIDIAASILFVHEVKEHLHRSGFMVDRFLTSVHGVPYFRAESSIDADIYTASYVQTGTNVGFADGGAFLDVVSHVAGMHSVLAAADISAVAVKKAKISDDAAKKTLNSLSSLKKKLLKAGRFSDFDMLFLRGYEKLAPHIVAFGDAGADENHICHNLLKEENIFRQNSEIAITNFVEAAQMHHLHDLAYIIKRHIKSKPREIVFIDKIVDTYAANCDMTLDEALFRRILSYPDKFIKVTMDYYSKKRSFAPNTYISRMQECLRVAEIISENHESR